MKRFYYKITNKSLIQSLNDIEVAQKAIDQYQACVKGNSNKCLKVLVKKLKRNFMVGKRNKNIIEYGNLCIRFKEYKYDKPVEIISVYNKKGNPNKFNIDKKLKKKIDKLIELDLFD